MAARSRRHPFFRQPRGRERAAFAALAISASGRQPRS